MNGHSIPNNKIQVVRIISLVVILTLTVVKLDIRHHEKVVRQQLCSADQPASAIYKVNNQEAVYVFGQCEGYSEKRSLQIAHDFANKPNTEDNSYRKSARIRKASNLRPAPRKVGASRSQKYMIGYAWQLSGGDEQFITMIEAESRWSPFSWEVGEDGKQGHGYGLCQVDERYWPEIVADQKFQKNWAHQVHTCLKLWNSGVTFYGHDRNNEMISRFWWSHKDDV